MAQDNDSKQSEPFGGITDEVKAETLSYYQHIVTKIWSIIADGIRALDPDADPEYDTNNLYDYIREGVEARKTLAARPLSSGLAPEMIGNCERCGAQLFRNYSHSCPENLRPPTLRDRFAMAALPTMITYYLDDDRSFDATIAAKGAYEYADAMMEARKSASMVSAPGEQTFSDPEFPFMADQETLSAEQARKAIRHNVMRERERCARIAEEFSINKTPIHPDIPWDEMIDSAKIACHTTAQQIAGRIRSGE